MFYELIKNRRSTRIYKDMTVEKDKIDRIMKAVLM